MKNKLLSFLLPVLALFGGKQAAAQQGGTSPLAAYKGGTVKYITAMAPGWMAKLIITEKF